MARSLDNELSACGCELGASCFKDLLIDVHHDLYREWNDEDIVCNPDDAKLFCREVRRRTQNRKISDELILKALLNIRKAGYRKSAVVV